MVILPGTPDAEAFSAPEGGVMVAERMRKGDNLVLMLPPDGKLWEDLEFVRRGDS